MGWKDADWAYTLDEFKNPTKAVLVAIAHRTDDKSHSTFVGHETIAAMTGLARSTVTRSVGVLHLKGVLKVEHRNGAGGYRTSSVTTLDPTYVAVTNVGLTNVGDTNVGDTALLSAPHDEPKYSPATAEEITQIDHSEDHPVKSGTRFDTIEGFLLDLDNDLANMPVATFDAFYVVWPKKRDKPAAQRAWVKATKRTPPSVIINAAIAYANNPHRPEIQFIPYPASWLNREGWTEELDGPPELRNRPTRNDESMNYLAELARREQPAPKEISA